MIEEIYIGCKHCFKGVPWVNTGTGVIFEVFHDCFGNPRLRCKDEGYSRTTSINYCPKCGTKLGKKEKLYDV